MSMIATILIGVSVLLIASGLDGSSLSDTFNKIVTNQPIDWTGTGKIPPPPDNNPPLPDKLPPGKGNKKCAAGYFYNVVTGLCEKSKGPGPQ